MTTEHQHPHDHDLAAQVQELKPPGCTCHITERFINQPELGLKREDNIHCPTHYPETSTALKGAN